MAVLEKSFGQAHGLSVAEDKLLADWGSNSRLNRPGLKPYPIRSAVLYRP